MNVAESMREELQHVITGRFVNLVGDALDRFLFIQRQVGNVGCGISTPLLASRNVLVGHDNCPGFEHDVIINHTAFQNGALVTNHHQIINTTRFEDTSGSNRHVMSNVRIRGDARFEFRRGGQGAHHRTFSHTTGKTNGNAMIRIGTDHGLVPNRRLIPVCYITNHRSRWCNKRIVRDKGLHALEGHLRSVSDKNLGFSAQLQRGSRFSQSTSNNC
mmetsp:Transcript_4089/g.8245  ORF Transcript_4089/g.8245 Transcript_4089/m.8245 type:complete len:216 (+) Transcript_4089:96-743(+)